MGDTIVSAAAMLIVFVAVLIAAARLLLPCDRRPPIAPHDDHRR